MQYGPGADRYVIVDRDPRVQQRISTNPGPDADGTASTNYNTSAHDGMRADGHIGPDGAIGRNLGGLLHNRACMNPGLGLGTRIQMHKDRSECGPRLRHAHDSL